MRRYHVANNFGRVLVVTLIVSLLATSAPTAAPALMTIAKQSERIVISTSHDSAVLSVLRRWLAYGSAQYWSWTVNNVGAKSTANHEPSASYSPLVISPAPVVIDAPTNLTVTATANTSISLSWTAPAGSVNNYQVERSQSPSGPFPVIGTPTATTFNDTTVSSGNAYLYRVRAVSGGIPSSPSNMAVGTAITYTDNPLSVGVTQIKAVHVSELRQSINAVRSVAGLSAASWLDTSLPGIFVKAVHIQEMRDRLGEALAALSVPVAAYTDPVLSTGANGTVVKKVHIEELRQRASGSSSSGSGGTGGDLSVARLDPLNRTGGGGEDPLSRNFNWSIPLVSLSGRAGLDLGLSLSYNSLVWTKSGSSISFDDDRGFPSPGFRLGFPVIQPLYFNSQVGKWAYLLITPDGSRVELRQVGTSALFESADSSYMLLDTSTNPMILRTTDGTQLSYELKGSDFQCTKIKDRNGNFITVNYTAFNRIDTVVDTLSRSIKFNYDGSQSLTSITQTWTVNGSPVTHTWASFAYSNPNLTIQTNFPGLTVVGPANGSTIKVLSQVSVNDGSRFTFNYTSWGQIWKISNFAPAPNDSHLRNYRSYNLPQTNSTAHSDCPRFTERRDLAANWNRSGPNGAANLPVGAEQEVPTTYAVPTSATWTMPDNTQQTGMRAQITFPDNTYNKIYFEGTAGTSSGWKRGLISLVETFDSANVRQRQAVTTWDQDTAASFLINPRVIATNVYDPAGNRSRTVIDYHTTNLPDGTSCRLPKDVFEYQANATTVLRRTHTEYRLTSAYTSRRIIGLVRETTLFEVDPNTQAETLTSKVVFEHDETGSIQGNDAPVQHDNTNYTSSFVAGRANLSSITRHDVVTSQTVTSTSKFNTAGDVVMMTDASNHSVNISYADAFAANGTTLDPALGFTTLAYPTTVTDADGYTASTRYNYDFGGATWKQMPMPNTVVNTPGPQQKFTYDDKGRVERVTNLVNNAYKRFIYGPNFVESFASVNTVADEAHTLEVFDGMGRQIAVAANHPGSMGGFGGTLILFDVMGRAIKQSNPTETIITFSGVVQPYNWSATGDDTTAGWVYTQQTYDWRGRSLITTHPDGATKEASYGGCGCAGGEVVTLTDQGTLFSGIAKKRQQKIYSDVLGRTVKTEVLNWDGAGPFGTGGTVYSATVNSYNARDQITSVKEYAGAATTDGSCLSGTCQETTMSYDGHGRLRTKHIPAQQVDPNNPASTDHTTWDYNLDDTIQKITDARGAVSNFSYNGRHLATSIAYSLLPGVPTTGPSAVASTAAVTLNYDAAGNRISMTDGKGSVTMNYDQLSRLNFETRFFSALVNSSTGGNYTINYQYNFADQMTSITDPFGAQISHSHDNAGRLIRVTGSLFAGVTQYIPPRIINGVQVEGVQYRASGAPKGVFYGNNSSSTIQYNNRLQPTQFRLTDNTSGASLMREDYSYFADSRFQSLTDLDDTAGINPPSTLRFLSRSYSYDHVGRVTLGRGTTGGVWVPFQQNYGYNQFGNMTSRSGAYYNYNAQAAPSDSATYLNNRRNGWTYDADGRVIANPASSTDNPRTWKYDIAANLVNTVETDGSNTITYVPGYDGDGKLISESVTTTGGSGFSSTEYIVRSAVLRDEVLTRLDQNGNKSITHVPAEGLLFATQQTVGGPFLRWTQRNPLGISETSRALYDPLGNYIPFRAHPDPIPLAGTYSSASMGGLHASVASDPLQMGVGCYLDGVPSDCKTVANVLGRGGAEELHVSSTGNPHIILWRLGIVVTDQLEHDTRVWKVWVPGSQPGFYQNPRESLEEMYHRLLVDKAFLKKLGGCLRDLFKVNPAERGFVNNADGSGGSLTFRSLKTNDVFTVTSDTSADSQQLANMTMEPEHMLNPPKGLTLWSNPRVNYIAKEYAKVKGNPNQRDYMLYLAIQVHETGNSIAMLLGDPLRRKEMENRPLAQDPQLRALDSDSGMALEECVFGAQGTAMRHGIHNLK